MKRSHIIAIVVIAVAIAAIVGSLTETSTYADFAEAYSNPGREYHVVGTLDQLGRYHLQSTARSKPHYIYHAR
jgi:cytochrome c-type biogenesis protein CcmE